MIGPPLFTARAGCLDGWSGPRERRSRRGQTKTRLRSSIGAASGAVSSGVRPEASPPGADPGATLFEIEREAILRTLDQCGGSTARAAEVLGVSIRKIQYRLKEYRSGGSGRRGGREVPA